MFLKSALNLSDPMVLHRKLRLVDGKFQGGIVYSLNDIIVHLLEVCR